MQTKKLGSTELNLSVIGLGTWAIGGNVGAYGWGPQDDKESIATIHRALEMGINWIDTAPVYGFGHSEEVVGKAINKLASKPLIATKCGQIPDKNGNIGSCLKGKSIRAEVEASLKRLKLETIDLYQIHWPLPDGEIEEAWSTLLNLKKEGKIRYAGASNFNVEQLKRMQAIHPVVSLQPPYSMLKRVIEEDLLDYCSIHSIGIIVYSSMQKGLLSGKFTKQRIENLPEDDHRRRDKHFQEPELTENLKLVEGLCAIARKKGRTVAQLTIAWVLRRAEVTAVIVGARRPYQIEETTLAGDWVLTDEDIEDIEVLLNNRKRALKTQRGEK